MIPSSAVRLFVLSCLPFTAMANSGYAATCNSELLLQPGYSISYPSYYVDFSADCREEDGLYSTDVGVNLSWCFANSNGVLVAQEE
ncbi:hypothetical protein N7493_010825 [Penicillium malachiteum]|uniref:Cyanovirin-N domain-containing protein n=1 Tax=Penicillium malachiteum TaxID=1324776 RepID=A0AAD6MS10_9EURO|nr:hypothetical protein N7493_010825 [Penicillium malachiteum]